MIRGEKLKQNFSFYSETEFDLTNIKSIFLNDNILELGRSCIHPKYRDGKTLTLLWHGISKYIKLHNIKLLFGCVSFPGTDLSIVKNELNYLNKKHFLPDEFEVRSKQSNVKLSNFINNKLTSKSIFKNFPPLFKGYLRIGGLVSKDYFIDYELKTIDFFMIVFTDHIKNSYREKFFERNKKKIVKT